MKRKKSVSNTEIIQSKDDDNSNSVFHSNRRTVKELISPNGINPNPLEYMIVHDNGMDIYTMCLYIHKLPLSSKFAVTFSSIFNYPNVTSSVFIEPMTSGKSTKKLDKRVITIDSERIAAVKSGDINKERKLIAKLRDAEKWAEDVESGDNMLYEVQFLFVVQDTSLENLKLKVSDLHIRAREKGIELMACYSVHPEAFLSSYPLNKVYKARYKMISTTTVKKHVFDKGSLCTFFNHTSHTFSHKNGIIIGKNLNNGQLVRWDNYDTSHDGFGVVVCGKVGSGKSALVKMISSRNVDFDYVIRSIDFDSSSSIGEYGLEAISIGGINYQIKSDSDNILDIFEIDTEDIYDEITGKEYTTLLLKDKITDIKNIILTMLKDGNSISDFSCYTFLTRIISDTLRELFEERGIYDLKPESLYTDGDVITEDGQITAGKVKKELPMLRDFYKKILIKQSKNKTAFHDLPYQILVDGLKDYVRELYYCPEKMIFFSKEEFLLLPLVDGIKCVVDEGQSFETVAITGSKPYFDGHSSLKASVDTPHINIDISQLPKDDKIIALLVAMDFISVNCVKKNSNNPVKAKKMLFIIDELHRTFPFEEARKFVADAYRTYRKRNVAPWSITQALADYDGYDDTKAIVKNSTSIFLFKQAYQDQKFLKEVTPLTDSQIKRVLSLGGDAADPEEKKKRRGECCLIDNGNVVFFKSNYLFDSESLVVETDIEKKKAMYKGR